MKIREAVASSLPSDGAGEGSGWNVAYASQLDSETVRNGERLRAIFCSKLVPPEIDATPNGTITFEWNGPGVVAFLEVGITRMSLFVDVERELVFSVYEEMTRSDEFFYGVVARMSRYLVSANV